MSADKHIAVIGSGLCDEGVSETARSLGRLLAEKGYSLVCGGLGGVMNAASQGAREAGGHTIGILPGFDHAEANPNVEIPIATGLGHMRNFLVVLNADIVVAVEGGYGTLSEMALALKTGKKVIVLGKWKDIPGVIKADNPEQAVELVEKHLSEE